MQNGFGSQMASPRSLRVYPWTSFLAIQSTRCENCGFRLVMQEATMWLWRFWCLNINLDSLLGPQQQCHQGTPAQAMVSELHRQSLAALCAATRAWELWNRDSRHTRGQQSLKELILCQAVKCVCSFPLSHTLTKSNCQRLRIWFASPRKRNRSTSSISILLWN